MDGGVPCPSCGTVNPEGQRFCGSCGARLTVECPACNAENPLTSVFCGSCGGRLDRATAAQPLREERRLATVMFADLAGFTALSEQLDPEDVKSLGAHLTRQMGDEVLRFGGTVTSLLGDAVMAVFGAPVAHEDDAERAVRCALAMRESVTPPPDLPVPVRLHVGINTGQVMAGLVGPEEHREYAVMGDVTNTAARLQSAAPSGEILVGHATYRATEHAIQYEEVAPIEAKGKGAPVLAWRVLGSRGRPGARPVSDAPIVGRDTELELLDRVWNQTESGSRAHLVTVVGHPGIGKSRLVREFTARLAGRARVLAGRSLPYGEATGYDAFVNQVRTATGILESDPPEESVRKIGERVRQLPLAEAADDVASHLAILMGLPAEGAPDKQLLFASVRAFVEALGRESPTVLLFEDLHWAQDALLDLIEALAPRIRESPVLMLATARPSLMETRPAWGGGLARYTAIDLQPLDEADARRLAANLLPEAAEALDELVQAGGGNPLFLEELAVATSERASGGSPALPQTLQAIIAARLDALPERERAVVQDASVVGRFFWRDSIAALAGEDGLEETLDSLEARDLIRRRATSTVPGDPEYVFKHALIREVAYGTLARDVRRSRHASVAEYLEETPAERAREQASTIAHHWKEAGDPRRAVPYLLTAAEAVTRTWAKERAIALYGEVIDILGDDGDPALLEPALIGRARAMLDSNQYGGPELAGDLDRLIGMASGRTKVIGLQLRSRVHYWRADSVRTRESAEEAAELARSIGDAALEARARAMLGEVAGMDGDLDLARELSTWAATNWPPESRDGEYAYSSTQLAITHYWAGSYEEGLRWARVGYEQGLEASSLYGTLNGAAHTAILLAGLSRHEEAIEWFERATALGREWEPVPRFTARAVNMWSGAVRELGDLSAARAMSLEAEEMGRRATFPGATISAGIDLLVLDLEQGEVGAAERTLPGLLEQADATKGWHQWLFGGRLADARARLELLAGRPDAALAAADDALARALGNKRSKYAALSRTARGEALLALGRFEDAADSLRVAAAEAERLGHAPSRWAALAGLARTLDRLGDDAGAEAATTSAREVLETFAATLSPERRATLLAYVAATPASAALA